MAKLLIIYHSRTGGAEQMAQVTYEAAKHEVDLQLLRARDTMPEHLLTAEGYIFVAPENLAALSGEMKEFFDRCYYPVLGLIEGRPYAQMICAGSDGENAVRQLARIATGWRLKPAFDPLIICTQAQSKTQILAPKTISKSELDKCRETGTAMGAGLAMGIY